MRGDPDPVPVRNSPRAFDPDGILRGWKSALRGWGICSDISRIVTSVWRGSMRPAVEHLKKRIPDRIGRAEAALGISTSANGSECGDATDDGNQFFHFGISGVRSASRPLFLKSVGFANDPAKQFFRARDEKSERSPKA